MLRRDIIQLSGTEIPPSFLSTVQFSTSKEIKTPPKKNRKNEEKQIVRENDGPEGGGGGGGRRRRRFSKMMADTWIGAKGRRAHFHSLLDCTRSRRTFIIIYIDVYFFVAVAVGCM